MDHFILIVGACLFLWRKLNHFLLMDDANIHASYIVPMRGDIANAMRHRGVFFVTDTNQGKRFLYLRELISIKRYFAKEIFSLIYQICNSTDQS